jgi:hypothetical protein
MNQEQREAEIEEMRKEQAEDQVIGMYGNLKANYMYETDKWTYLRMMHRHTLKPYLLDLDLRAAVLCNETRLKLVQEAKKRGEMPDQSKEFLEYVGAMEAISNQADEITRQYVIEDMNFLSEEYHSEPIQINPEHLDPRLKESK